MHRCIHSGFVLGSGVRERRPGAPDGGAGRRGGGRVGGGGHRAGAGRRRAGAAPRARAAPRRGPPVEAAARPGRAGGAGQLLHGVVGCVVGAARTCEVVAVSLRGVVLSEWTGCSVELCHGETSSPWLRTAHIPPNRGSEMKCALLANNRSGIISFLTPLT